MADLIYQEDRSHFHIDACLPQISAADTGKITMHALTHGEYPGKRLPTSLIPEVSTLGYMDIVGEQDWGMEDHRNEGIELCLQESGENELILDGRNHTLSAGQLSITRPWQLHRVGNPYLGPGRLHWVVLDVGVRRPNQVWRWPEWCVLDQHDLTELSQLLRGNEHPVWQADRELIEIFKRLSSYADSQHPESYASRITITINQLLIVLLETLRSQHITTEKPFSAVAHTVELFLRELQRSPDMLSIEWTLDRMAEHCGMKRTAFTKYCYELQNVSPIDYLNRCRLKHAAQRLIDEKSTPITTIAFDLGFASSQYFARVFKQAYDKSPSEWRAQ